MECSQCWWFFVFFRHAYATNFPLLTLFSRYASFSVKLFAWIARAARDEREIEDAHATIWDRRRLRRKKIESNEECFFGIFFLTSHVVVDNHNDRDDELAIFHRSSTIAEGAGWCATWQCWRSSRSVGPSQEFLHPMKVSLWSHSRRLRLFLEVHCSLIKSKRSCLQNIKHRFDHLLCFFMTLFNVQSPLTCDRLKFDELPSFFGVKLVSDNKQDSGMRRWRVSCFFRWTLSGGLAFDRINKLKYFRAFYPFVSAHMWQSSSWIFFSSEKRVSVNFLKIHHV